MWLEELKNHIKEDMELWMKDVPDAEPYDYVAQTGIEPWLDMFNEGLTPIEAWEEEKSAIAQDVGEVENENT